MAVAYEIPDFGLANEHEKDEKASDHVQAADDAENDLHVKVAVLHAGVVAVQLDVNALAQPRHSHDQEQLREQHQLLAGIVVVLGRRNAQFARSISFADKRRGLSASRSKLHQVVAVTPQGSLKRYIR